MGSTGALVAILAFLDMVAFAAFMLVVFMAVDAAMVVLHDDCYPPRGGSGHHDAVLHCGEAVGALK